MCSKPCMAGPGRNKVQDDLLRWELNWLNFVWTSHRKKIVEEGCIVEAEIEPIWLCRSTVQLGLSVLSPLLALNASLVSSTPSSPTTGTYFLLALPNTGFFIHSFSFINSTRHAVFINSWFSQRRNRCQKQGTLHYIIVVADYSNHLSVWRIQNGQRPLLQWTQAFPYSFTFPQCLDIGSTSFFFKS